MSLTKKRRRVLFIMREDSTYSLHACIMVFFLCIHSIGCASYKVKSDIQIAPKSITYGWNGLEWGATLAEAKDRFIGCQSQDGELFFSCKNETCIFCGIKVKPFYKFNDDNLFYYLILVPELKNRARLCQDILLNFECQNNDNGCRCLSGDLKIEINNTYKIIIITNKRLSNSNLNFYN